MQGTGLSSCQAVQLLNSVSIHTVGRFSNRLRQRDIMFDFRISCLIFGFSFFIMFDFRIYVFRFSLWRKLLLNRPTV